MKQSIIILLLTLINSVSVAQTYYKLDMCKQAYEKRMYESILPSLLHIKNEAENGGKFDAWEYFDATDLLSKIYTHYYKDPEYSARIMLESYRTIALKTDSTHDSPVRLSALKLAEVYLTTCQYEKAEKCIDDSEKLFEIAQCDCEIRMWLALAKINYCRAIKNTTKLRTEINNVIKSYKNYYEYDIMNGNDFLTFSVLDNVAAGYKELGETSKAETYWEHIATNIKIEDSQSNTLFNSVINSLATIRMERHQWQEALDLYDKIKIFNDYYSVGYFKNILTCALFVKNIEKIKKYYILFSKEMVDNKSRIFFKSTEENHYNAWMEAVQYVEFFNFVAYKSQMASSNADAFASTVFFKSLSVQSNIILKKYVVRSGLKTLMSAYEKCRQLKHNAIFSTKSIEEKKRDYLEYERLFDSILIQSQRLAQTIWNQVKTFGEIKRPLSENDFVIEFCLIPDYEQYPKHNDYFGAYIIGKNFSVPKLVKLADVSTVEKILEPSSDASLFYSKLYSPETSRQIYDLIFKPLEPYLKTARNIYYSPYGILANVNFDYLADDSGNYLRNKYKTIRLASSTQTLTAKSQNITAAKTAVLYGNINYETMFSEVQKAENNATNRGIDFKKLPATKLEIQKIREILDSKNVETKICEQTSATEQSFKNLSGNFPEILHLATHGFCFDTKEKAADKPFAQSVNTYSQKESAMVLSGLALSGANNAWKGNFDLPNVEDGILTAYEISQLDLSNTKLVVLSACETARGRIFPVDGVFGLQRAFKQAGAGSILMSLWKVDDNATATFMEYFYKFLFETGDRHEALKLAQDEVRKQHPDPWYWAAWVMLD